MIQPVTFFFRPTSIQSLKIASHITITICRRILYSQQFGYHTQVSFFRCLISDLVKLLLVLASFTETEFVNFQHIPEPGIELQTAKELNILIK